MKNEQTERKKPLAYNLVLLGLVLALQIYIVSDEGALQAQTDPADSTMQTCPLIPDSLMVMPSPGQILPFKDGEWDPLEHVQRMQERMSQMFGTLMDSTGALPSPTDLVGNGNLAPEMDLQDEGDRYVVHVVLPESDATNLEIDAQEESLTIHGTREEEVEERDANGNVTNRSESSSRFSRSLALPEPVLPDKMESRYEDGVLLIELPKKSVDT